MRFRTRMIAVGAIATIAFAVGASTAMAQFAVLTIDPKATLSADRTEATLTGTINCPIGDVDQVPVNISEIVGRLQVFGRGFGGTIFCTGAPVPWSAVVLDQSVKRWVPGPANANAFAFNQNFFQVGSVMGQTLLVP